MMFLFLLSCWVIFQRFIESFLNLSNRISP